MYMAEAQAGNAFTLWKMRLDVGRGGIKKGDSEESKVEVDREGGEEPRYL